MNRAGLPQAALERIVAAVIRRELRRLHESDPASGAVARLAPADATHALGLDSLERMGVAAALGEFFEQERIISAGDTPATIRAWADHVACCVPACVSVYTSGTTGRPQTCRHAIPGLLAEARAFANDLRDTRRVVALVPADHLYGMIWCALLPSLLDVPVIDGTVEDMPSPDAGDLIVGVPEQWAALARLRRSWPSAVVGVSSGGPLADETGIRLRDNGLSRLLDVYGASETGAIGVRCVPETGHVLLPRWQTPSEDQPVVLVDEQGQSFSLPDRIERLGPRRIVPAGRHDRAVPVGGVNVYPERIAALIADHPDVADAAVRPDANGRLKGFVVPRDDVDADVLASRLRGFIDERLSVPERPRRLSFGPELPRSALGKPTDWD